VCLSLAIGGGGLIALREAATRSRREQRLAGGGVTPELPGLSQPKEAKGVLGSVKKLGEQMALQDPAQISVIRQRLMHAGFFSKEAVAFYLGARAVCLGAAVLAGGLMVPLALNGKAGFLVIAAVGMIAIVGMMGPDKYLEGKKRKLQLEYNEGFPDMLDLLVASVEAGLSLDAAVSRVGDELVRRYPHLAEHVNILTLELRAGRSRKDAWSALAERLGTDDARQLATMLRQAEEMGTSLGETLSIFSDDMRVKRMLRAEEKAMALPAKLMVPLILFIFPCLLGVLILPAAFRISQTLIGAGN
ncbi:MAG TPA: type II secretion system F family protein, partial [Caulobacteraceae bacterium]|nr:type II secretion system F family protein [Caulobacteraceae bacterium]